MGRDTDNGDNGGDSDGDQVSNSPELAPQGNDQKTVGEAPMAILAMEEVRVGDTQLDIAR